MSSDPSIVLAEARVAAARQRLGDTLGTLQARLDPRTVARDAVENIAENGEKALRSGVDTARAHPAVAVGALTLAGALLARRLFRGRKADAVDHATAKARARSIPGERPYEVERNDK